MAILLEINFKNCHRVDIISGLEEKNAIVANSRRKAFAKLPGVQSVGLHHIHFADSIIERTRASHVTWEYFLLSGLMEAPYHTERGTYPVWRSSLGTLCDHNGMYIDKRGRIVTPWEPKFFTKYSVMTLDPGELERIGYLKGFDVPQQMPT